MPLINELATVFTNGTEGNDTIRSAYLLGDKINGLVGNDTLFGAAGADWLFGGEGNDRLFGFDGNDLLNAGTGDDRVDGGAGHDTIIGGGGADRLKGGAGADFFQFNSLSDSTAAARDQILDYSSAEGDTIFLRFLSFHVNVDATTFIGDAEFTANGRNIPEIRVFTENGSQIVEIDRHGDGIADMQIEVRSDAALTFNDFFF